MIVAVVQARMSSTRLPGKVLADVFGRPMILRQVERLQPAAVDRIVVATSSDATDDALATAAAEAGYDVFRGAVDNVLDRVYRAVQRYPAQHVVRLTADCPLADYRVVDRVVSAHLGAGSDYTSNTLERTYPDGFDVEVVTAAALERAWRNAVDAEELEHVTPYVYRRPERFTLLNVANDVDHSRLRLTVDYEEDLELIREIFAALYPADNHFALADIVALFERRPDLLGMNAGHNAMLPGGDEAEVPT